MLAASEATGVATYARALRTAQTTLATSSSPALLLGGGAASAPGSPATLGERWRRWLRAALPLGAAAKATAIGFERHDLFRLAQMFFTLHDRPMSVYLPGPPGVMHWSYPAPLRVAGWCNLYTVHDVIPLTHPGLSPIEPGRHRRLLERIAGQADALIAVSASAATEIATTLGLPSGQVIDCSQPVTVADPDASLLPDGLTAGRYLLVCGTVEPRKNIARILAAYHASGTALCLVVAGPDGWRSGTLAAALADTPGVIRLPYQSRESMIALIAHARALLMPSLVEGFGLPVAEAMALGTPVITSATGALAETAGDAALLVDPTDIAAIAAAIARVARDDELVLNRVKAGRRQAARYDAATFARRLGAVYDDLVPVV